MAENPQMPTTDAALAPGPAKLAESARAVSRKIGTFQRGSFVEYSDRLTGHRQVHPGDKLRHPGRKKQPEKIPAIRHPFSSGGTVPLHLVLDGSESMDFGSEGVTKFDFARSLSACLAWLLLQQGQTVQVSFLNDSQKQSVAPVRREAEFAGLVEKLAGWQPAGAAKVGEGLRGFMETLGSEGPVVLLSDFFDEDESWMETVKRLRFEGRRVWLVQILDVQELRFPFRGRLLLEEMEGGGLLDVQAEEVKDEYLRELAAFLDGLRKFSSRCGSGYYLADSSRDLCLVFEEWLRSEAQAAQV